MRGIVVALALIAPALAQPPDVLEFHVVPGGNDGKVVYRLLVPADVPVDGFWSVSVGEDSVNSVNSVMAKKSVDGAVAIQFGECDAETPNCLPIWEGWSYTVRLHRPRSEALDGRWKFPAAVQRGDHWGRGLRG